VVPSGTPLNGTHFASFQAAYNQARAGDTIQIDHGATLSSSSGIVTIGKQITVRGEASYPPAPAPVTSDVEVQSGTSGVVFDNLNFSSPNGLTLDRGSRQTTVKNSVLDTITEVHARPGDGNSGNLIEDNTITGIALLNGDVTIQTADQILRNHFTGNANLYMVNNNGALVQGNTFDSHLDESFLHGAAIEIHDSTNVQIVDNTIHVTPTNPSAAYKPDGIFIFQDPAYSGRTSVTIAGNNTIDTAGKGIGLLIYKPSEVQPDELRVKVERNNFSNNAVGVSIWGNFMSAGTIDLGGGALGSVGLNNFQGFAAADTAQGRFAIALHATSAQAVVAARHNLWFYDPSTVIKDGTHNVSHAEAAVLDPTIPSQFNVGTGQIDVDLPSGGPGAPGAAPGGQPNGSLGTRSGVLVAIDPWVLRLASWVYVNLHAPDPGPDLALARVSRWLVSAQHTSALSGNAMFVGPSAASYSLGGQFVAQW
jgi:hypothetical protein